MLVFGVGRNLVLEEEVGCQARLLLLLLLHQPLLLLLVVLQAEKPLVLAGQVRGALLLDRGECRLSRLVRLPHPPHTQLLSSVIEASAACQRL